VYFTRILTVYLIEQAAKAIYGENENNEYAFVSSPRMISEEEINAIYSLMKSIRPRDMLETLYASQIVVSHMLGMKKLAQSHLNDQILGAKLLRLSNDAIERLERKRNGGHQNISVTYHNNAPSMQALVSTQNKE
jgi:hypothetical protein